MTTTQALPAECFPLLSLREVAALLGVAPVTIYRLVQKRSVPFYRLTRSLRFSRSDVLRWMAQRRRDSLRLP